MWSILTLIFLWFQSCFGRLDEIVYIMTRDNVSLLTRIFYPDEDFFPPPWSVLYEQSPYSASDLIDTSADYFTTLGFAFIGQEERGREGSNGTYSFFRTSGNDSIDTIQWFVNNGGNWSDGLLAVDGISADCLSQYADLTGVTQSGYWPNGDYSYYLNLFQKILTGALALGNGLGYQTVYQGGAYREGLITGWLDDLDEPQMVTEILENENFGPWWYTLDGLYDNQWNILNITLINFAGWYDIFGSYQIQTIIDVNQTASPGAKGQQILFVDPGGHCPLGAILWEEDFYGWEFLLLETIPQVFKAVFTAAKNKEKFDVHKVLDWNVLFYMLGPGGADTKGNFWVLAKSFPPIIKNESWYFTITNGLINNTGNNSDGSYSYLYDPFNPVKTWGGNNLIIKPCGPQDQIINEHGRSDILHFDGPIFDDYYTITGDIKVVLYVSSDAVDTDFTAKLIDMYPDGREMLVNDGIIRMRWRNLIDNPFDTEPAPSMVPNQIYKIIVDIGHMSWIFNPGHGLRVSISSSNYKRFSVNYNSGNFVINGTVGAKNATNTVYFGEKYPSKLILPIVDLNWVEQHKVTYQTRPIQDYTNGRISLDKVKAMKNKILSRHQSLN